MRVWLVPISLLLMLPPSIYSQSTLSNKVSYEGQFVAKIELVANPKIPVDSLYPLIQQHVGEPYSNAKVSQTVSALRATERFNTVNVDVKPEVGGLELNFILEPALYFGIFDFPGALKSFSFTKLLQVIDISSETPYKPNVVSTSADNLRHFLIASGFFQAEVHPETQPDGANMLANVIYNVNLGKRAKLGDTEIRGAEPAEVDRLRHATLSFRAAMTGDSLKPGKPYTQKRIDAGSNLMRRDLASRHHLTAKVGLNHPEYHPETNRADLIFDVTPGPIVKVSVSGAKLSALPFLRERKIRQLIPIFSEGTVDPDLVEEGRRNLVDFFQDKGYFNVRVSADLQTQQSDVSLTYTVDRGIRQSVQSVGFRGNRQFSNRQLGQQVTVKSHRRFLSRGRFSDKLLRQSVTAISTFYKDQGYQDVQVDSDVVHHDSNIDITFQVAEGAQTLVDNLTIEGSSQVSAANLTPKGGFRLRAGQPFSPKSLAIDRTHIMAVYLDRGFLNAEFDSQVTKSADSPNRVEVTYKIVEKQRAKVEDVVLLGNKHTRDSLVRQTVHIQTEAPISEQALLSGESRLTDLQIFDWARVVPKRPITDQTAEDVLVKLHEAGRNEISYGFGLEVNRRGGNLPAGTIAVPGLPPITSGAPNFTAAEKTFFSPRGSITFTRYNFRGLAESLSGSILLARLDQRALATYTQPHFRGSGWSSLFSGSIERTTENPTFTARLAQASWQLEKPLNKDKTRRIQLRYRFGRTVLSNILIPELILPQDQRVRLSTLSATWIRDTRDKPLDAHRGFYQTVDLGITPTALGSSANFARLLAQSSYYKQFGGSVWANRITLGLVESFADSYVPTSELFFSGGETTLRGFPINGAGPQRTVPACTNPSVPSTCVNLVVPVGGRQLFILNSEWRFPLHIKEGLGAAVFYDGGNVYGPIGVGHLFQDYTNTVGVGLRYATPVGPVRFDIGRNLNPIPGVKATQFYITLGQAF
jgi:outer membrane protein insertion porin family